MAEYSYRILNRTNLFITGGNFQINFRHLLINANQFRNTSHVQFVLTLLTQYL